MNEVEHAIRSARCTREIVPSAKKVRWQNERFIAIAIYPLRIVIYEVFKITLQIISRIHEQASTPSSLGVESDGVEWESSRPYGVAPEYFSTAAIPRPGDVIRTTQNSGAPALSGPGNRSNVI